MNERKRPPVALEKSTLLSPVHVIGTAHSLGGRKSAHIRDSCLNVNMDNDYFLMKQNSCSQAIAVQPRDAVVEVACA